MYLQYICSIIVLLYFVLKDLLKIIADLIIYSSVFSFKLLLQIFCKL